MSADSTDVHRSHFVFLAALVLAAPLGASGEHPVSLRKIGSAMITYYWVVDESDARYRKKPHDVALRDRHGRIIEMTSARFKQDLSREGTGWLRQPDARTVTFDRVQGGESRFRITTTPFGAGTGRCPLVSYRTIAVDPQFLKLGSKISIPALRGAELPDGTRHDGVFFANDRAPFRGAHIDVFTAAGPKATRPFVRKGVHSRSHVTIYLLEEPRSDGCTSH